jgi:acyl-coenzyme A synthetase/AMP-(fatty) acid ligase
MWKPGVTADHQLFEDLKAHVKAQAGMWKYPHAELKACANLPKTTTGKIQRFKLREIASVIYFVPMTRFIDNLSDRAVIADAE